jgi:hypothetical protein
MWPLRSHYVEQHYAGTAPGMGRNAVAMLTAAFGATDGWMTKSKCTGR